MCRSDSAAYRKCWKPIKKRGGIRAATEPAMFLLTGISNLLVIIALFYNYTTDSLSCTLQETNSSAGVDSASKAFCLNVTGIHQLPWFCCTTVNFADFDGAILIGSIVLTFLFIFIWIAWVTSKLVYCSRKNKDQE